jgi:hypothetical protein
LTCTLCFLPIIHIHTRFSRSVEREREREGARKQGSKETKATPKRKNNQSSWK